MKTIIMIILMLTFATTAQAQSLENYYKKVDSLLVKADIVLGLEAINILTTYCKADTAKANYWAKLGEASWSAFRVSDAYRFIDKALKINPKYAEAYYTKARLVFDDTENFIESRRLMDKAVEYDQTKPVYYFYRGIYLQNNQELAEAIKDYEQALKMGYKTDTIYRNYALALMMNNQLPVALQNINKAIGLAPAEAINYKSKGDIYLAMVNPKAACSNYELAIIKGYPANSPNLNSYRTLCIDYPNVSKERKIAGLLINSKMYYPALKAFTQLIKTEKKIASHYLNRGAAYFNLGKYLESEKDYLTGMSYVKPSEKNIRILLLDNLSSVNFRMGKYKKAKSYSEAVIKIDPQHAKSFVNIGLMLNNLNNFDEAIRNFEIAIAINPQSFRGYGHRAFAYLSKKNPRKAMEDAKKSLEINPRFDNAWLYLGEAKRMLGIKNFCADYERAVQLGNSPAMKVIQLYCVK